jgi:ribosomal protein S18 acetylase RimI-like enzyme
MDFEIRAYRPADYEWVVQALTDLQAHEYALHDSRQPAEPAMTKVYLNQLLGRIVESHGILLIAERHGVPVGVIGGYVVDEPTPIETDDSALHAYISELYIRPEQRGSGLAERLFDTIAAHFSALPLPLTRLRVNVLAANRMACRAYEKHGFRPYEVMYERPLRRP